MSSKGHPALRLAVPPVTGSRVSQKEGMSGTDENEERVAEDRKTSDVTRSGMGSLRL